MAEEDVGGFFVGVTMAYKRNPKKARIRRAAARRGRTKDRPFMASRTKRRSGTKTKVIPSTHPGSGKPNHGRAYIAPKFRYPR